MFWKCKVCAHISLGGSAPDNCPVCGVATQHFEEITELEAIEGTRTEINLKDALAGESQANIKYLAWAIAAELEGHHEAATLFRQRAEEETVHAMSHLIRLGLVGKTKENLAAAVAGETHEKVTMYPDFQASASGEGFKAAALNFKSLARREGVHADAYSELLSRS